MSHNAAIHSFYLCAMKYNFQFTWHRKVLCVHDARMEADRQAGRASASASAGGGQRHVLQGGPRPATWEGGKEGRTVGTGIGGPMEGGREGLRRDSERARQV